MNTFRPHKDYILIQPLPPKETKTKSGIIVPTDQINTFLQPIGLVHQVGPDVQDVVPNMKVIYSMHAGLKHTHKGQLFVFLHEHEIVATVSD